MFYQMGVRDKLRLAIYRQSVCLGAKAFEAHDQRFFFICTLAVIVFM
jgi:hypothetical protein